MPPRRDGGKGKGAKKEEDNLNEEERLRRNVEERRVQLRARLLREQEYAREHAAKINTAWRQLLRKAKVEELRAEIQVLSQGHEREIDRRDAVIQMLDRDLEDAEDQYLTALRGHMQALDALLDLQELRIQKLDKEFRENLSMTEQEFESERQEIVATHVRQKKDLQDIIVAMEAEFARIAAEAEQEFEAERTDIKNRAQEEYHVTRIQQNNAIEDCEAHYDKMYKTYMQSSEKDAADFQRLAQTDKQDAKEIEREMNRLARLHHAVQHWRLKIANNEEEWSDRNAALRDEKDVMTRHYAKLKGQMDRFRRQQQSRLKELSRQSGAAMEALRTRIAVAERILKLAEFCRRLETEQEKVLPFWSPAEALADELLEGDLREAQAEASQALHQADDEASSLNLPHRAQPEEPTSSAGVGPDGRPVPEWDYLNNFFKKYNKVLLDVASIRREKQRLQAENEELRRILKHYLDGISVSEDVMQNPVNPLLVVNERLQRALKARATGTAAGVQAEMAKAQMAQEVELVVEGGGAHS